MRLRTGLIICMCCCICAVTASAQAGAQPLASTPDAKADPAGPTTSECVPVCRQGFTCVQGACVAGCNPPCAAGERCTELGQCTNAGSPDSATGGAIPLMVSPQPQDHPELGPGDPGWATGAGVIGVVGAAAIAGLTAGSVITHGKSASAALGIAGLATMTIVDPIVAIGARSARDNPVNQGLPTVRVLSWIGYGVTLASGIALSVYGVDHDDVAPGLIASVGMLGVLSTVGFAVDAFTSARQATSPVGGITELERDKFSVSPLFALAPSPDGALTAALGARGTF
jgi:hypothetical protein